MATRDNLHSWVVAWLKVILPLCALALLSTLFLVARHGEEETELPFTEQQLEEMASEQRVDVARFSGTTEEGRSIEVSALSATPRPDDLNIVDTAMMVGTLETGDHSSIHVTSDAGTVLAEESRAQLRGNVRIETSTGYTILTEELETALDSMNMDTTTEVTAEGPLGRIDAGRMTVTSGEGDDVSVVFKDGVKLLYLPQTQ
ncbi:lipopolysaccharide export system protein LptC [Aliiruegeria haliotis]|uniref:Lipopolysaccharide export system protein LptC n=1 Tax=Aliiruegeria haliotis TaxID=1280846 RepID=A0A2T0RPF7_9RHOB|nr:LPS export ABC transporter periplasmic protein LptC [Aliiruegeria haliotis]PRY23069.1 lipopolysaccharide export system protein LptC [Aliiruegeria haliotis]